MAGIYWKHNGLSLAVGNTKLGPDTIILNMGAAYDCPSKALGMCAIPDNCYAAKAECMYPNVLPCCNAQKEYWLNTPKEDILSDITQALSIGKRSSKIRYLRFNESGDFWSQKCVDKLSYISAKLELRFGLITYGYTARHDLDYSTINFILRGSSHDKAPHGRTIARRLSPGQKQAKTLSIDNTKYRVCPMDCRKCRLCKANHRLNIIFPLH